MPKSGQIEINGRPYFIIQSHGAYKVSEVPAHWDADPRMERRVLYSSYSLGIGTRREQKSTDTSGNIYNRQTKAAEGIWWSNGCDTRLGDRMVGQRATSNSNFTSSGLGINSTPIIFGDITNSSGGFGFMLTNPADGSTGGDAYYHIPATPQTWILSKTNQNFTDLSVIPVDAHVFNGKLYVGVQNNGVAQPFWTWDATSGTSVWTNGNAVTTLGLTANSGQNHITFGSSPSGFANGQTVIVGGGANAETLVISSGAGTTNWTMTTNLSKTHSPTYQITGVGGAGANPTASYFAVIRNQLWRSAGANIYSSLDGSTWSNATVIGDPNLSINAIDVYEDFLYIFKPDGIYSVDRAGQVYPVFPGFRFLGVSPRIIGQWGGSYLFGADTGMIWEITHDTVNRIGFDRSEPYPMAGGNLALPNLVNPSHGGISLPNFLLAGFNQSQGVIVGGYVLAWDGEGWHPFEYFTNTTLSSIGLTGAVLTPANPTLHMTLTASGNSTIKYMSNPLVDPFLAASFDINSQVTYLPVDNGALEDEDKIIERVNCDVDYPNTGSVRMAWAVDDKISTLNFSDFGPPVGDRQFFQTFNAPSPAPKYKKIGLRVTITPDNSTNCPMVRNITLHYKQRGPQRRTWDILLLAEENIISQGGSVDSRNARKILKDLNALRVTANPVSFQDIVGENSQVYIDEVGQELLIFRQPQAGTNQVKVSFAVPLKLVEALVQ